MTTMLAVATLGTCLIAGIFFAFSTFLMHALARLAPAPGIAAMQAINVTVLTPWFLVPFLGTGVLCLVIPWFALDTEPTVRWMVLAACGLYVIGCVVATGTRNVPMNERLAAVDPTTDAAHMLWADYLARWTFWNHVRTAASLAAAALFTFVLVRGVDATG